jgi:hypothetical protein
MIHMVVAYQRVQGLPTETFLIITLPPYTPLFPDSDLRAPNFLTVFFVACDVY